jgi:hypothetical protein
MPEEQGTAGFEGHLGAVLIRNGKPVAKYDLDSWWMQRHPIARLVRVFCFWRKR